jgi:hypothetical protein
VASSLSIGLLEPQQVQGRQADLIVSFKNTQVK